MFLGDLMKEVGKKAFERLYLKEAREHPTFTKSQVSQILRDHGVKLKTKAKKA